MRQGTWIIRDNIYSIIVSKLVRLLNYHQLYSILIKTVNFNKSSKFQ